MVKNQTVCQ